MDESEVREVIDMMYAGDISAYEAMNLLEDFDGDLIEFL
jgi:hypothetical protein